MAKKSDILRSIKTTAEFLGNSDRPSVCTLRVDSLSTLKRNTKGVQYTRKSLRAFAKAVLTERQSFREGIYILKDVNIKALKDSQLGELLSATNPNGDSKYYTTVRRMTYQNILADAIASAEEEDEPEAKPQKKTTKKARKPKASKKPKLTPVEEELFDEDGNLDPQPKAEAKPKATKPKASKVKKAVPKGTVTLTAVINGKKREATLPKADWEGSNHSQWEFKADSRDIPTKGRSKKELAVLVGVHDSIFE
jgi:Tfp pilus assembly protein PilE